MASLWITGTTNQARSNSLARPLHCWSSMLRRHDAIDEVHVHVGGRDLRGSLGVPLSPAGLVVLAGMPDLYVAESLRARGLATLTVELELEASERYDIELLASRLVAITDYMIDHSSVSHLPIGYLAAGTGAAAALV